MMGYQLFKDVITGRIIEMLPPLFWNHEPQIHKVKKVNQDKEALIVVPKEKDGLMSASPAFYLDELYEEFKENQDMDALLEKIACDVVMYTGSFPCGNFKEDIASRREHIILSLINTERNRGLLENVPHEDVLDMSVIYRIIMNENEDGVASMILTNDLMNTMGLTKDELSHIAYENTEKMYPAEISKLTEHLYMMTNRHRVYGAALILYKENMEKLAEYIGGDFFIIPSSIHEVMAISVKEMDLRHLIQSLAEGNSGFVEEKEVLSNTIYYYDAENRNISMAASYFGN